MTVHNPHPRASREVSPILFDDCPRCIEHTKDPVHTLDNAHIRRLREAWEKEEYHSRADKIAAERLFGTWRGVSRSIF